MDDKQDKRKQRIQVIKFICATVMLIMAIWAITYGWFTENNNSDTDGTAGQAVSGEYKIASCGENGRYDNLYVDGDGQEILQNGSQTKFYVYGADAQKPVSGFTSSGKNVVWEMTSSASYNNYNTDTENASNEISPGTWGYVDFYIIPNRSGTLNISCELDLTAYCSLKSDESATENQENGEKIVNSYGTEYYPYSSSEADNLNSLLKGHVMFFTEQTDSDGVKKLVWLYPNDNGKLEFDVSLNVDADFEAPQEENVEKYKAVKQRIYWVWTSVMGQAVLSDERVRRYDGNYKSLYDILTDKLGVDKSLISDADTPVKSKLNELLSNTTNYGYFFLKDDFETVTSSKNSVFEADGEQFDGNKYTELRYAWNNADQEIGSRVGYITVELDTYGSADN